MPDEIQKILQELKKGLVEIFGDQLQAVVLFGSFARGDAHPPDSDIDVMVILKGDFNYREVENRSIHFVAALCLEHDVIIICHYVSDKRYVQSKIPFMVNVRRDAVAV